MKIFETFIFLSGFFTLLSVLVIAESGTEADKLRAFFDEEWEYGLKENPLFATMIGDLRYNDRLGDYSLDSVQRNHQHNVAALAKLKSIDRTQLSEADKLNFDLYLLNLQRSIEGHQFPEHLVPITQLGGIHQSAPDVVPQLPFRSAKHYDDYLKRLSQFPQLIDQVIERMRQGLSQKITPPKITLRDVGKQIESQIVSSVEKSAFYEPFKKFDESISAEDQKRLREAGRDALNSHILPAYRKLHDFWTKEYYPNTRETIGISSLPNGPAWYQYLAKASTTTDLTPQQIHEIGLKEVARIRAEMDQVIAKTGFKNGFNEFLTFLRTDPQFYYTRPEDLLTGYRDICKRIDPELPRLFGKLPRLPYGIKEVPEYSAPSQTTAYYNSGSLEAGRPGWYFANTYKLETRPKWEMEALSIHEAVPGHHLQIALAQELENVPKFRNFGGYTAFVEGWGLYSESLGEELGLYKDPYSKFGQLTYEMWRAVRLVIDTGIHVFGWDRQKAIDYFKANAGKQEHDIIVEVDRYIVWPAQALAYKIGELKIKELRAHSEKQLGERFDIRQFHDTVLGNGAVPLSVLEKTVNDFIVAQQKK